MNWNEFALYYIFLPWGLALLSVVINVFMLVLGGSELRTLIGAKMDRRAQFVMSFTDGGVAHLKKMYFYGEHGVLENNGEFMLYTTPLSDTKYEANQIEIKPEWNPEEKEVAMEINKKRLEEAARMNSELPKVSEEAKRKTMFAGKPLWIGNEGLGVAVQPSLLKTMEESKRGKTKAKEQKAFTLVSFDTIKDFMSMNFSPKRLMAIFRNGEDAGMYGRPKKPLPSWIWVVLLFGTLFLLIGGLIVSGKLDLGGWAKNLMGG